MSSDDDSQRADQKNRRAKIVLLSTVSALLIVVVVGIVAAASYMEEERDSLNSRTMRSTSKSVKMICSSTDYKQECESSLTKVVAEDTDDPKELIKAAISVVFEKIDYAFNHSKLLQSNDSRVRGAMEDCDELYDNSKDHLEKTLKDLVDGGLEGLPKRQHDIRTWLSAVITFTETCIDGFPEGELKEQMRNASRGAKELTSNALAIVGQASDFLSFMDEQGGSRRLLTVEEDKKENNEVPSWISQSDRRMLKQNLYKNVVTPNVTVAKDGSGDFTNITAALKQIPKKRHERYVIYVKAGIYEESFNVTKHMANLTMIGDGSRRSIITGHKNFIDGFRTIQTATVYVSGEGFMAIGIGFRNTAGAAKHQAVALRVASDKSIFLNCRMEGYQDTLYAHANRQYYRSCVIAGTIDFIFGDATVVFQNCIFVVRRPLDNQQTIIAAQGRTDRQETTGFVLHHCKIKADNRLKDPTKKQINSFLARPWKTYSRTIIMESEIGGFIHTDGFLPWNGDFGLDTLYYAEFNNTGLGANITGRITWPGYHVINKDEADLFTVKNFIDGEKWTRPLWVPVQLGMYS